MKCVIYSGSTKKIIFVFCDSNLDSEEIQEMLALVISIAIFFSLLLGFLYLKHIFATGKTSFKFSEIILPFILSIPVVILYMVIISSIIPIIIGNYEFIAIYLTHQNWWLGPNKLERGLVEIFTTIFIQERIKYSQDRKS